MNKGINKDICTLAADNNNLTGTSMFLGLTNKENSFLKDYYREKLKVFGYAYKMTIEDNNCEYIEIAVLGKKDFSEQIATLSNFNTENALKFYAITHGLNYIPYDVWEQGKNLFSHIQWLR